METQTPIDKDKESITLKQTSKGFYYWEIKVKDDVLESMTIDRLETMDKILREKYGSETD